MEDGGETALGGVEVLTHGEDRRAVGEREYAIEARWEQSPRLKPLKMPDANPHPRSSSPV